MYGQLVCYPLNDDYAAVHPNHNFKAPKLLGGGYGVIIVNGNTEGSSMFLPFVNATLIMHNDTKIGSIINRFV